MTTTKNDDPPLVRRLAGRRAVRWLVLVLIVAIVWAVGGFQRAQPDIAQLAVGDAAAGTRTRVTVTGPPVLTRADPTKDPEIHGEATPDPNGRRWLVIPLRARNLTDEPMFEGDVRAVLSAGNIDIDLPTLMDLRTSDGFDGAPSLQPGLDTDVQAVWPLTKSQRLTVGDALTLRLSDEVYRTRFGLFGWNRWLVAEPVADWKMTVTEAGVGT